ncbi:MAG: hypothetical protein ACI4PW_03175 [Alphaproteobacteria bacterium]
MIGALKGINSALASLAQPSAVQGILPVKRAPASFSFDEGTTVSSVLPDENQENEGLSSIAGLRPENPLSSSSLASVFSVLEAESATTDRAAFSVSPAKESVRGDEKALQPAVFGMPDDAAEGMMADPGQAFGLPASTPSATAEVSAAARAGESAVLNGRGGILNLSAFLSVNAPLQVQAASVGAVAARSYAFTGRLAEMPGLEK